MSNKFKLAQRCFHSTGPFVQIAELAAGTLIGRCAKQHFDGSPHSSLLGSGCPGKSDDVQTHILLSGSFTFVSSPLRSRSPAVLVHRLGSPYSHELLGVHGSDAQTTITNIAFDQSPPTSVASELHLAAFYETGEYTVFAINHKYWSRSRILHSYCPAHKTDRTSPIIAAAYRHPLLVTLSQSFHLSFYNMSGLRVVHMQTLSSFTSFPPTSLVLTAPSPSSYKLVLAYSMPVYPNHWSAASTELMISSPQVSASTAPCTVTGTRTIRAFDVPPGWIDTTKLQAVREQWGRKVGRVADIQTDGKWVVLAPADSTVPVLQLYRLHLPPPRSQLATRLSFVRSLHGHSGAIASLYVSDGRCVSLGSDGSLWVWDLEQDWSAEAQTACRAVDKGAPGGTVVFDDRKIVTADAYGIEVRRFDV